MLSEVFNEGQVGATPGSQVPIDGLSQNSWSAVVGNHLPRDFRLARAYARVLLNPKSLERVLTDINADYGNRTLCCRSHGVLLILVPLASLSLAGQEHGPDHPITGLSPAASQQSAPRFKTFQACPMDLPAAPVAG
jgi:hypothetical protein